MMIDLSADAVAKKVYHDKFKKDRRGRLVKFAPGQPTGITLHQTDCVFEETVGSVPQERLARRALKVNAHITVFRQGFWVLAAPLDLVCLHANGLNMTDIGIEVEGRLVGRPDDRRPKGFAHNMPANQADALDDCLDWLIDNVPTLRYLHAHRQSNRNRRRDPGHDIWASVGLIADAWGLDLEPNKTWGSGRPLPREWGPYDNDY